MEIEEIDSLLPRVRLLDLIKAERYGGCERLIALNTKRLYLNRMRCLYDTACIGACPVSLWSTLIEFTIAVLVRSSPPIAGHFTLH